MVVKNLRGIFIPFDDFLCFFYWIKFASLFYFDNLVPFFWKSLNLAGIEHIEREERRVGLMFACPFAIAAKLIQAVALEAFLFFVEFPVMNREGFLTFFD